LTADWLRVHDGDPTVTLLAPAALQHHLPSFKDLRPR